MAQFAGVYALALGTPIPLTAQMAETVNATATFLFSCSILLG